MRLKENEVVCDLCRDIIDKEKSKRCVLSVEWGSFSGTPRYGTCCKKHKTDEHGYVMGRAYA